MAGYLNSSSILSNTLLPLRVKESSARQLSPLDRKIQRCIQFYTDALKESQQGNINKARQIIEYIESNLQFEKANKVSQNKQIRIYTLGRFEVEVSNDEKSQKYSGKAKSLEFLKCLISFGGRKVNRERIIEVLWPDAVGDGAQCNFRTTLHRLRKILKIDNALVVEDSRLSLNSDVVWLDIWCLERNLGKLDKAVISSGNKDDELLKLSQKINDLYQGVFLEREAEYAWMLPIQERIRNKMITALKRLSNHWLSLNQYESAIMCIKKAIEIDPVLENLYIKLMKIYIQCDNKNDALSTFVRARMVLSNVLNVSPSNELVTLYNNIKS